MNNYFENLKNLKTMIVIDKATKEEIEIKADRFNERIHIFKEHSVLKPNVTTESKIESILKKANKMSDLSKQVIEKAFKQIKNK
jgi:hypothetical protein